MNNCDNIRKITEEIARVLPPGTTLKPASTNRIDAFQWYVSSNRYPDVWVEAIAERDMPTWRTRAKYVAWERLAWGDCSSEKLDHFARLMTALAKMTAILEDVDFDWILT